MDPKLRAAVDGATRKLLDQGKVIEAGWLGFAMIVLKDASAVQKSEMRLAFYAGAQHLFASIMTGLEEDAEPTDADMRRMDNIRAELDTFAAEFRTKVGH